MTQYYCHLHVSRRGTSIIQDYTTRLIPGYALPVLLGPSNVPVIKAQKVTVPIHAAVKVITHDPVKCFWIQQFRIWDAQDHFGSELQTQPMAWEGFCLVSVIPVRTVHDVRVTLIWALWVATRHFCGSVDSRIRFIRDEILGRFFDHWVVHDEANMTEEAVIICQSEIPECHDLWIIRFLGAIVPFLVLRILIAVVVWLWLTSTFT